MRKMRMLSAILALLIILTAFPVQIKAAKDPIMDYIKREGNTISYQYINLKTGKKKGYKANNTYAAASTVKLPLVLYVYEQASAGKINLNDKLTYKKKHYYGGSGIIQKHKVGSKYTIRKLAEYAFVESDNIAFTMLREKVGKGNFIKYTKHLGAKGAYPDGENKTTASDLAIYAKRLYEFAERDKYGKELVSYLERSVYRTTIPKGIKGVKVANKAGLIPMNRIYNDAAIIYDEKQPYVLTIMTNKFSYEKSQKVIANLARIIHEGHSENWGQTNPAVKAAEKSAALLRDQYYLKVASAEPAEIAERDITKVNKLYAEAMKQADLMNRSYGRDYLKRLQEVRRRVEFAKSYNKAVGLGSTLAEHTVAANEVLKNFDEKKAKDILTEIQGQVVILNKQNQPDTVYGKITRSIFNKRYVLPANSVIRSLQDKLNEQK